RARAIGEIRHTKALVEGGLLQNGYLHQQGLREITQRSSRGLNGVLAENIADADAQDFFVLEAVQDRLQVGGAFAKVGQLLSKVSSAARLVENEAVQQLVDHARIVDKNFRQELAPGAEIDIELQAGRVKAEQFPEHGLGAE